jgi:hypothetical protein
MNQVEVTAIELFLAGALFGLAVALAQLRVGLYSSPDGPYITGTGTLFRRR